MRCVDYEHGQRAVTHFRRLTVWDCQSGHIAFPPAADQTAPSTQSPSKTATLQSSPDSQNRCLSLAAITLETGRTHQIRVHMSHVGHPLIGDFLYNPAGAQTAYLPSGEPVPPMNRQALHSHKLEFPHPITGKPLSFTCEMPEDMHLFILSPHPV